MQFPSLVTQLWLDTCRSLSLTTSSRWCRGTKNHILLHILCCCILLIAQETGDGDDKKSDSSCWTKVWCSLYFRCWCEEKRFKWINRVIILHFTFISLYVASLAIENLFVAGQYSLAFGSMGWGKGWLATQPGSRWLTVLVCTYTTKELAFFQNRRSSLQWDRTAATKSSMRLIWH